MLLRRSDVLTYFSVGVCALFVLLISTILYGTRTENPSLPPIVKGVLPAGRCQCEFSTVFQCADSCLACTAGQGINGENGENATRTAGATTATDTTWAFSYARDADNYALADDQCEAAFPGLFEDLHRALKYRRALRPVAAADLTSFELTKGMVRALIYDAELHVLETKLVDNVNRQKALAALAAIHRALVAAPARSGIANIEFLFSVEDLPAQPGKPVWGLSRRAQDEALWLMPDFGFWAWDMPALGTIAEVAAEAVYRETLDQPWETKHDKLVWRGKITYAPKLRHALLDAARAQPWSDVGQVKWDDPQGFEKQFLGPVDQCAWKFIAHAEGRSYSGALKYRQLCRSVIISHKLQWIQHTHYLLQSTGPNQNYVEVERDFSDLADAMDDLLAHPEKAKRIADNSVAVFRERYLTPAAEACYWRRLFEAWKSVTEGWEVRLSDDGGKRRGVRWETFMLYESPKQMEYPKSKDA